MNRVVVFSNSELVSSAFNRTSLHPSRDIWTFSNHGGPAARELLAGERPRAIHWFLNFNPFTQRLNGCLENSNGVLYHPMQAPDISFWVMIHDQNMSSIIRGLATKCLGAGSFRLVDVGQVWYYSLAMISVRPSVPWERSHWNLRGVWGWNGTGRTTSTPSAGAVAALHERLSHSAWVDVYTVGFTGHCSGLRRVTSNDGVVQHIEDPSCQRFHDYSTERAIMQRAGIISYSELA